MHIEINTMAQASEKRNKKKDTWTKPKGVVLRIGGGDGWGGGPEVG